MANYKPWCWEATPSGPDWVFIAQVAPESAAALAQVAAGAAPRGFSYCARTDEYCQQHQRVCSYHSFIDNSNAKAYAGNLSGSAKRNLWIYNVIEVHTDCVKIECGYGGRGEEYNRAETAFLLELFSAPEITLRNWTVVAGGDGYDYKTIREGAGLDDLRSYIA